MTLHCSARHMSDGALDFLLCNETHDGSLRAYSIAEVVSYIERHNRMEGEKNKSVFCSGPPIAYVEVREEDGHKWVQTRADDTWTNNLLDLPLFTP
jgi:hypothetical protein